MDLSKLEQLQLSCIKSPKMDSAFKKKKGRELLAAEIFYDCNNFKGILSFFMLVF